MEELNRMRAEGIKRYTRIAEPLGILLGGGAIFEYGGNTKFELFSSGVFATVATLLLLSSEYLLISQGLYGTKPIIGPLRRRIHDIFPIMRNN